MSVTFTLNGEEFTAADEPQRRSLLDVLRGEARITSAKDGCAPQGQCGCCTVLVDGKARVACVTPVRRVAGREVTTLEGLEDAVTRQWADALLECGGSQCGFCTPGIVMRLEDCRRKAEAAENAGAAGSADADSAQEARLQRALAAHLCRCTGWQGITEAAVEVLNAGSPTGAGSEGRDDQPRAARNGAGNIDAVARRAALEGGRPQRINGEAVLGRGGFAAGTAPRDALIEVPGPDGDWVVGQTMAEVREAAAKVQGRRTTLEAAPPIAAPQGRWDSVLRTSWVEPAYLETDASWCEPGGEPADPLANGGAFGAKSDSPLPAVARRLADEHGRAVLALWSREDSVRHGPKRPPVAMAMNGDGRGIVRVARTDSIADAILVAAPGLEVEQVDVVGPPTSAALRAAGWAEAFCASVAAGAESPLGGIESEAVVVGMPTGATARVEVVQRDGGRILVAVDAGDPLDEAVLRSYVIGAVHMAAGWVCSEGLAVDDAGDVCDLTIRSFGVLGAAAMPPVEVVATGSGGEPVGVGDAVFAATAAALWRHHGFTADWPLRAAVL